jgi:hypothetical protein
MNLNTWIDREGETHKIITRHLLGMSGNNFVSCFTYFHERIERRKKISAVENCP